MNVKPEHGYFKHVPITADGISKIEMVQKNKHARRPISMVTTHHVKLCTADGERQCEDGSCISTVELCPEEQLMNQNTILIMIVVGMAVVVFLIILYCFQQRQRRANQHLETETGLSEECDNESLYAPPPSYDEVIQSNMYPASPEQRRLRHLTEEPSSPMTPPPNYDTALVILAQSEESILQKTRCRQSSLVRRSLSMDQVQHRQSMPHSPGDELLDDVITKESKTHTPKSRNIFRFSGRFSRHYSHTSDSKPYSNSSSQCQSNLITPPPYPQTPPVYPLTPPPPCTPLVPDIVVLPSSERQVLPSSEHQESMTDNQGSSS